MGADSARLLGVSIPIIPYFYSASLTAMCRDAEITAGIICGCMPVLPAFYRHVVQLKSRLGSGRRTKDLRTSQNYRKSKEVSPSNSGPSIGNSRSIVAPWEDGDIDDQILQGSYLELDDKAVGPEHGLRGSQKEMDSKDIADEIHVREIDNPDLERGIIKKAPTIMNVV